MVEEVVDAVLEDIGVEEPAAEGNLEAELMLLVALAVEGNEGGVVGVGEGEGQGRRR